MIEIAEDGRYDCGGEEWATDHCSKKSPHIGLAQHPAPTFFACKRPGGLLGEKHTVTALLDFCTFNIARSRFLM
jgi:hypothetical protein